MHVDEAFCYRRSSVDGRSVTIMSPAKMAEPIKIPFGVWPRVGQRNRVLDRGPDASMGRGNFEGSRGGLLQSIENTIHVRR